MESSIEVSKTGGTSNPKPSLAPKPRLAPKPFSLQKNTAIRSIHAPKPVVPSSQTTKQQTGKSEATGLPKPTVTTPAKKLPQQTTSSESKPSPVSVLTKAQPNTTKESKTSPCGEDTLDSSVGKSDPASQTTPPKETPKSKPVQKDDVIQANHRASTDIVTKPQDKGEKKNDENHTPVIQNVEEPRSDVSSTHGQESRWGGSRKRLSMELTSKFESAGLSLPSQPTVNTSTTTTKNDANKPRPSDPEQSQTAAEPPDRETDEGTVKEDYTGGSSIKRRISLLFDSSSRPEAMTKREEPEIINGTEGVKGVKERIKNWVTETTPEDTKTERRPQVAPRPCSKSFEPATAPKAEETPQMPPVEPPATLTSRSQAVDLPSKVSSVEQPTETPMEIPEITLIEVKSSESSSKTSGKHVPNESTEGDVQLRKRSSSMPHTSTDEADSARCALKRDSAKRRSVHFGVVVRDDGGPPLILGSASDSSEEEEEEEASGDEAEEDNVSVPVHRGVAGLLKRNDDEAREQEEQLKHLEFEKRRRAEENEQARLKLEEERKQKEEEEREKEKARQREEEERERERLKAEEMERRRKEEWERECLEEARERQREEMERKRQLELMLQRQREEEQERARQKEERLKRDQEEREKERLKEEERLREERGRQRQREEMERERQLELMLQRQREEERERAKQKEERLREEEERLREEEKRLIHDHEEHRSEGKPIERRYSRAKKREEEWEKEWMKQTETLGGEEEKEREKELELMWQRKTEEDRERARQRDEREEEERSIHDHEEHRSEGKPIERRYSRAKKREEEWEKEWVKQTETLRGEEEREREKELELMWQRKTEEDRERARQVEERLRQEEREKERLREEEMERERERQRRLKELQEREKEMERMRQIEMERRSEEERREEERKRQIEKERVEELERKMREELDRKRAQELEEKLQMEEERKRKESAVDEAEPKLISFDSDDVSQKSDSPYPSLVKTREPPESQIKVVYDDFSVKPSVMEVDFDDFSVKPIRWGSQAKAEASPLIQSWEPVSDKKEVEAWSPLEVRPWEFKEPEKVEKPHIPELTLPQENPVKEEEEQRPEVAQFISMEVEQEQEKERVEEEETREEEVEEEDKQEAPVNSYSTNAGDNDALIDNEPGQQNEACESEMDSPMLDHDHVPEVSVVDVDTTDSHKEPELPPFPESSTPLLDTSAQRSKADLGRRRSRSRPSRALLGGLSPLDSADWRTSDSTDKKETSSKEKESDSEDEQPKAKIVCSPPTTSQRVPMFPGLSPAALLAQIKKKTGGGGEETEEDKGREEKESHNVEAAPSPSQLSRSPRNAAHLAGAARVLPPIGGTDGGAASSPAWLKELKSKKRMSQFDGEA